MRRQRAYERRGQRAMPLCGAPGVRRRWRAAPLRRHYDFRLIIFAIDAAPLRRLSPRHYAATRAIIGASATPRHATPRLPLRHFRRAASAGSATRGMPAARASAMP